MPGASEQTNQPPTPRTCATCGRTLDARGRSTRCRACANRAKRGTFTPDTARAVRAADTQRRKEEQRLAELARRHGLA